MIWLSVGLVREDVIFALPLGVVQTLILVHRDFSLSCAWRLTLGVSRWTPANVKMLLPPGQSRGRGASLVRLAALPHQLPKVGVDSSLIPFSCCL
jgi:hypothetical protein